MSQQENVLRFNAELTSWLTRSKARVDEAVRHIGFAIAENIIVGGKYSPGSPVDTGFFRGNWFVGLDEEPPRPAVTSGGQVPADALQAVTLKLMGAHAGQRVLIFNYTDYGIDLEYGHSQQAPEGMVRITVAAGQALVNDVVKQMRGSKSA